MDNIVIGSLMKMAPVRCRNQGIDLLEDTQTRAFVICSVLGLQILSVLSALRDPI